MNNYDVTIIGCGEAGIFAAYELKNSGPSCGCWCWIRGADIYSPQLSHRRRQGGSVHPLQDLRHHVRLWRSRCLL